MVKPENEWVWTEVEPIVSEDLWDECNKILDDRHAKRKRVGRRPVHLFAGLIYCHCGTKMYVRTDTPKYICAECRNKIPIIDLEAIFYEELKGFFVSPAEVAEHLRRGDEHLAEKSGLLAGLVRKREDLRDEIQRVYRLYVEGKLDGEGFGNFYKPLQERQRQLDDEIPRLEAEMDLLKINHLSAGHILTEANDLYGRWPSLSREEKQRIVESITERITIGKDEICITLCHLPSSEEATKEQHKLTPAAGSRGVRPAASSSSPGSRRA